MMMAAGICTAGFRAAASSSSANWPQWRGPDGTGISQSKGLPTNWGPEQNILWKAALPSWSGATPIVWDEHIFITSPTKAAPAVQEPAGEAGEGAERGRGRGGRGGSYGIDNPGGPNLLLLCLSRKDGSVLWQRELDTGNRLHRKQNSTSPSPVTDGKHVWVVTGTGAVKAFDFEGREVWGRNLQEDYGDFGLNWGYASSPLLHDGKLIIEVLHGNNTDDPSYLLALDSATGSELWRQERPTDAVRESPDAYTTPAVLVHEGKTRIVVSGGDYVTAHDPASGEELWRAGGLNPRKSPNYRIIASPVVKDGMIFAPSRKRPLLALRAGGTGDVTTSHLAWKWEDDGGPDVPTPISDGKHFYMVEDSGMVTCLDAPSGERIWGPERTATGTVSASPLLADGKLYVTNERATTTVLKAGPEFEVLATNELDGSYTLSSPVAAGNQLFIRTSGFLYCIAEP
jgi:outer membrane protein assembly factor BamB